MKKTIWDLFKKTGDIKYYLLYTNMEKRSDLRDKGNRRDST